MTVAYPIFYVLIILGGGAVIAGIVLAAERWIQRRILRRAVEKRIAETARVYRTKQTAGFRALYLTQDAAARAQRRLVVDVDIPTAYAVEPVSYCDGGGI